MSGHRPPVPVEHCHCAEWAQQPVSGLNYSTGWGETRCNYCKGFIGFGTWRTLGLRGSRLTEVWDV